MIITALKWWIQLEGSLKKKVNNTLEELNTAPFAKNLDHTGLDVYFSKGGTSATYYEHQKNNKDHK